METNITGSPASRHAALAIQDLYSTSAPIQTLQSSSTLQFQDRRTEETQHTNEIIHNMVSEESSAMRNLDLLIGKYPARQKNIRILGHDYSSSPQESDSNVTAERSISFGKDDDTNQIIAKRGLESVPENEQNVPLNANTNPPGGDGVGKYTGAVVKPGCNWQTPTAIAAAGLKQFVFSGLDWGVTRDMVSASVKGQLISNGVDKTQASVLGELVGGAALATAHILADVRMGKAHEYFNVPQVAPKQRNNIETICSEMPCPRNLSVETNQKNISEGLFVGAFRSKAEAQTLGNITPMDSKAVLSGAFGGALAIIGAAIAACRKDSVTKTSNIPKNMETAGGAILEAGNRTPAGIGVGATGGSLGGYDIIQLNAVSPVRLGTWFCCHRGLEIAARKRNTD